MRLKNRFNFTGLYGITAAEYSSGRSNPEVVREMLEAGIKVVQYREKEFAMREKYRECLVIRDLCRRYGACFIVNDDVHLALAVEADGVHIGQDDLPPEKVRELVGDRLLIGLSTHSPEQARQAAAGGIADYIGVGPLFPTSTKKGVCAPVGLEYLDYVVKHIDLPCVAIGGIKQRHVSEVVRHGAICLAMVTEIVGAPDIGERIRAVRMMMER